MLAQRVDPDTITRVRPRDAWLLNRANVQPSAAFAPRVLAAATAELEAARDAESLHDLFLRLERAALLQRIVASDTHAPVGHYCTGGGANGAKEAR